ncbi:MAG TPA: antibiotic biosynthesis monooxygenase family protein [Candidatus Baltobacteraceae bacterium]|nr:antibiotic biosynthesis monooxygenase family protein [Candidatus Baltobacteraceae bacterium]
MVSPTAKRLFATPWKGRRIAKPTLQNMFTVIYRWRLRKEREAAFLRAWHARTEKIRAVRGSYGSRLHREEDGTYCAIALWPSRAAWEATEPPLPDDEDDAAAFRGGIKERLPTLTMDVVDDLWCRN